VQKEWGTDQCGYNAEFEFGAGRHQSYRQVGDQRQDCATDKAW
jgi:hypothetical protein